MRKKIQATLPDEIKVLIEEDAKDNFMSLSKWIERACLYYLQKKKNVKKEKIIDLGI